MFLYMNMHISYLKYILMRMHRDFKAFTNTKITKQLLYFHFPFNPELYILIFVWNKSLL